MVLRLARSSSRKARWPVLLGEAARMLARAVAALVAERPAMWTVALWA